MTTGIDTLRLTAEGAIGLVERGEVSAAELHAAYLDAIGERNDELHAYLRTVDEADGTSIPIALKDVISTRGIETTAGSKILAGYKPVFDATVAARCKAAGLTWETTAAVLECRYSTGSLGATELARAKHQFAGTTTGNARRMLSFWQVRAATSPSRAN